MRGALSETPTYVFYGRSSGIPSCALPSGFPIGPAGSASANRCCLRTAGSPSPTLAPCLAAAPHHSLPSLRLPSVGRSFLRLFSYKQQLITQLSEENYYLFAVEGAPRWWTKAELRPSLRESSLIKLLVGGPQYSICLSMSLKKQEIT